MPVDHIRYDLLTQQALRGVLRRVLGDAAKSGLPGEHHFYVTFDTQAVGVRISPRLREEYPEAMTIVLQHQFYELTVSDAGFEVGLSFGGVMERLSVPFEAVTGFFDPSVQFGLQFETADADAESEGPETAAPAVVHQQPKPARARRKPQAVAERGDASEKAAPAKPQPAPAPVAEIKPQPDKPSGGAEVVRLDRFRKK